ncbi:hypothetical protein GZ78_26835 [Endozoicomonas numazuensis]|uniref:Penicillin-binding C-terminal domain-containing protein n=2 Tax=Endozoicomonas numazuensis TaxID=1137799 RepID=A0A081N3Y8_9GAMM|nr:hypothetical protein GZ78_26835 [Endozoicomonas numazuensis]
MAHDTTAIQAQLQIEAIGGQPDWYWFLNGELLDERSSRLTMAMPEPGTYQLSVTDQGGQSDQVSFTVEVQL